MQGLAKDKESAVGNAVDAPPSPRRAYQRLLQQRLLLGLAMLAALALLLLIALGSGSYKLDPGAVAAALVAGPSPADRDQLVAAQVIWSLRLPRVIAALLAGASLGLAGAVLQGLLRNPLASPFTLGISQGAAFGATCAIVLFDAGALHAVGTEAMTLQAPMSVVGLALAGGFGAAALILMIGTLRGLTPEAVVLAGIALGAFASAATMIVQYFASDTQAAATLFWTFGDLGRAGWSEVAWLAAALVAIGVWPLRAAWHYNALAWGDDLARGLGVSVARQRLIGTAAAAALAAMTTAFLGVIGFIGLTAPHLIRLLIGGDQRFLLPFSALAGALILLGADTLARVLIAPVMLPVGAVTALLGAPLLLVLLLRQRR
ncbi:MAG: iron ABC transporter permease [Chromatiaceae bacterium]|nr:iron ABC transporter permease [Chromatiaceae bacterium]